MNQVLIILTIFVIKVSIKIICIEAVRCVKIKMKMYMESICIYISNVILLVIQSSYLKLSNVFLRKHYIDVSQVLLPDRAIFERLERLRLGLLPPRKLLLDSENIFRKL